jgi:hypothetical protein
MFRSFRSRVNFWSLFCITLPIYIFVSLKYIPGVSEMGTIILSGNKTRQEEPISLVTFWGKIALKRYKNHRKFSST